ncbi:serine/threonine-protein phosphatase [bacterium]|nr:serine/threonine-protein phosphatase [bacterium]
MNFSFQSTVWRLIVDTIIIGLFAALWVYCFTLKKYRLLIVLIFTQIIYYLVNSIFSIGKAETVNIHNRLILDGMGIMVMLILGFIFFINFILTEGLQHVRFKTEIELAKEMHNNLVPIVQFKNDRFHIYGKSIPTETVGGDIVDLYDDHSNLTCYIADVAGHGVKAGLMMGMFKTAMHMNLKNHQSPALLLTATNETLYRLNERSMFLTCVCIRLFENQKAEFSVAGHLPILYYNRQNDQFKRLITKQIAVSVKANYQFVSKEISFYSGDLFVLLSDGLIETHNQHQEEFGFSRIENIIRTNMYLSMEDLFDKILVEARQFGDQQDDQTLMFIQCL